MKSRLLYAVPFVIAVAGATMPAAAADSQVIDVLLGRIEKLTLENARLTVENDRLTGSARQSGADVRAKASDALSGPTPDQAAAVMAAGAAPGTAVQFSEAMLRQWVQNNALFIYDSVNAKLQEKQQAAMPKPTSFQARAADLFEKDAIKAGAADGEAKVRLVMFADYNCSYCKQSQPTVEAILAKNPDVQVVYRDFPILSPTSRIAAQAGKAAALQGRYKDFHAELYKLPQISEQAVLDLAGRLGLDRDRLKRDMTSEAVATAVTNDFNLAQSLNIQGTPFFYVDGADRTFPGAVPESELQKVIDQLRKAKG